MVVYITREQRIWQVVWVPSELLEKLHFVLFYFICNFTKIFLLNLIWRSIFWNTWWIYGFLYSSLLYNFYAIKFLLHEKYGMLQSGKLLGLIVSQRGIELDLDKVRVIVEMSHPYTKKEVRGFLGRLNYIARFIFQLTATCEPIFKLLRKNQVVEWNEDC